jgi:hypothetical protein
LFTDVRVALGRRLAPGGRRFHRGNAHHLRPGPDVPRARVPACALIDDARMRSRTSNHACFARSARLFYRPLVTIFRRSSIRT